MISMAGFEDPELKKLKEQERLAAETQAQAPAPAEPGLLQAPVKPMTPFEQLRDNHGTGGAILRMIGTGLSGGLLGDVLTPETGRASQAEYASNLKAYNEATSRARVRQEQADFFNGLDPENMTLAQMAQVADYDSDIGNAMFKDYQFGRRVDDIRRAQGFMNDGVEDENDLWAQQTFGRYGMKADGGTTTLDKTLQSWGGNAEQFEMLPSESQEAILYEHGTDEYRAAQDRVAGRQTTEEITADAKAKERGAAVGRQVGEDRKTIISSRGSIQAIDQQREKLTGLRDDLASGNADTGWGRIFRDAINANTAKDGTMDEATASGVIDMISKATFGALSQSELDLLKGGLMDPSKSAEYNIGTLTSAIDRLDNDREVAIGDARASAGRYKEESDYDQLMQDDWTYLNVGEGSQLDDVGDTSFSEFYEANAEEGFSRDQIVNMWAKEEEAFKKAEEDKKAAADAEAEQAKAYMAEAAKRAQEAQQVKDRQATQAETLVDDLSYGILRSDGR